MHAIRSAFAAFVILFAPAAVQAQSPLGFEAGWIRAAPPGSPVLAGYVALVNDGAAEAIIDRVESDDFGVVELHEMRDVNGVMRMRPLPELRIEPGQRVRLAPGGKHLMLFRPQRELQPGDLVDVTFVLRDGSRRAVPFAVRKADDGS